MFHVLLGKVIPEKFTDEVTSAIFNEQSIRRKITNILLKGLPGSGKTSLLDRLLNKPPRVNYSSTGMCEKIVIVQIDPSSTHTSVFTSEDNTWKVTDFDESVISQLDSYKEFIPGNVIKRPRLQHYESSPYQLDYPGSDIQYHVREVLNKHDIKNIADLRTKNSLYIRDTGGQVEFQESLSLLIFGPSIFIFVMRTDIDIHTKNIIQYRSANGESINQYQSSISTMDALIQFLTSVSAIQTTDEGVLEKVTSVSAIQTTEDGMLEKVTSVCHEPIVFIVGTHIDMIGSEAQSVLDSINLMLHNMICERNFLPFVRYSNGPLNTIMYKVDNTSSEDQQFQKLRSDINKFIQDRDEFLFEYPVSYLLFCLELHSIHETVLSMDRCKKLAAKFYIEEEEMGLLLRFLHFRVGIIQHYDIEGLSDVIIKEPQVLFNKVTELILKTFSSSGSIPKNQQDSFCKRGILEASVFKNLLSEKDKITPDQFLKFLLHLRVAVSITDKKGVLKYFIPSVLNHVEESPSDTISTVIDPLAITFKLGHCPQGLFGMLISYLLNPKGDQNLTFDLIENQIYQDQVSLRVKSSVDVDQICLRSHLSHLEVSSVLQNYPPNVLALPRKTSPSEVCSKLRQTFDTCLQLSLNKLHYDYGKVEPYFSLKCHLENCCKLHEVQLEMTTWAMHCSTHNIRIAPSESGMFWFNEGR